MLDILQRGFSFLWRQTQKIGVTRESQEKWKRMAFANSTHGREWLFTTEELLDKKSYWRERLRGLFSSGGAEVGVEEEDILKRFMARNTICSNKIPLKPHTRVCFDETVVILPGCSFYFLPPILLGEKRPRVSPKRNSVWEWGLTNFWHL